MTGERLSGPWRPALLAVVVLLLLALPTTISRWSAQGRTTGAGASAGTLDLRLDGALAGAGGSVTVTGSGLSPAALPGESVAAVVTVANAGDAPFAWTATGTATGALAPSLRVSVHPGGTASSTGTAAAGTRRGTCSTTATFGPAALTATASGVVTTARRLDPGATERLCVVVALASDAPTTAQGATGAPTLTLTARQVAR